MPGSEGTLPGTAKQVLIVDDDDDVSSTLSELLTYSGYQVTSTFSGSQALDLIETNDFAVIILDLAVPGMGGISVLHELRERGDQTPVVVLSAYLGMMNKDEIKEIGASEVLDKPSSADELTAVLARLTGG